MPQPQDDVHWQDRTDLSLFVVEALQVVCRVCPVMQQCGAFAADVGATWGCWAGQWRTPRTPRTPAATPPGGLSSAPHGNYPSPYPDHPPTARQSLAQVPSRCPADTTPGTNPEAS